MNTSYTVKDSVLVDIPTFTDERGAISVMDKELPFIIKRVFWLHHIKEGKDRGAHALLDSEELMIAIHGSFVVDLDDTETRTSVLLDDPRKGLIIKPGIWFRTHKYMDDGVSLILSSEAYSRGKYTYNYDEFICLRKKRIIIV